MNYYELKHSAPRGLRKKKTKRILTPAAVMVFFAVETLLFLVFGSIVQLRFGLGGVAITELGMLVLSVVFVLMYRADLRSVFPVRRPRILGLIGCFILWFGAILTSMLVNLFLLYWFPEPYKTLGAEDALFQSVPFLVQILIVAILPAICEEALHRGVMQSGISSKVRNTMLLSLIMGSIFAVFHLYPIKYPGMLILGGMMSYILAVTGNMMYSSFVHFVNNFISLLIGEVSGGFFLSGFDLTRGAGDVSGIASASDSIQLSYIGILVMSVGIIIPFVLYLGGYLLKRAEAPVRPSFIPKNERHPVRNRIVLPMILIFLAGLLIVILS